MGFFTQMLDSARNGEKENIVCQTCGDTYRGNVDGNFPYAICGKCLEREGEYARDNGDNKTYRDIQYELQRRANTY